MKQIIEDTYGTTMTTGHGARHATEPFEDVEQVIVAPVAGIFGRLPARELTDEGELVAGGQAIGVVACPSDDVLVVSSRSGVVVHESVLPGDHVSEGQPLAWVRSARPALCTS